MKSLAGSSKDSPLAANLFINHLPKGLSALAFHDTFEQFGKVLSSKLALDHLGSSKGYGFVQYALVEDAQSALKKTHQCNLDFGCGTERLLQVSPFIKREARTLPTFTNVFFRNLPIDMDHASFLAYAGNAGEVTSAILNPIRKPKAVTKTGCANYKDSEVAKNVVEAHSDADVREIIAVPSVKKVTSLTHIKSQRPKKSGSTKSQRNLKVKPIPLSFTDADLSASFSKWGKVLSAKVKNNPEAKAPYGFVCFQDPESALKALKDVKGNLHQWSVYRASRKPHNLKASVLEETKITNQ